MLKTRDFLVIAALCLILFIFFLAFSPSMYTGDFRADESRAIKRNTASIESPAVMIQEDGILYSVAVIGGTEEMVDVAANTLKWMQVAHTVYDKVSDIRGETLAIITDTAISSADIADMKAYLLAGGNVIFAALPQDLNDEIADFLGIKSYVLDYQVIGFTVYEGMLLGGIEHNENHAFTNIGVELYARTKVFANGYDDVVREEIEEGPIKAKYPLTNPLIWRAMYEGGEIYVVNAPFMAEASGSGVLAGILALHYEDFIYPIIGTKTVALKNFPYIADIYYPASSRTGFGYTRDTIWPSLLSTAKNLELLYSCYTNGHFSESYEAGETLTFVLDELYRLNRGELAYAFTDWEQSRKDLDYLHDFFADTNIYGLLNAPQAWDNVTSVSFSDEFSGFMWMNDAAVTLPITGSGIDLDESTFDFECFVTAFGFAMHQVDLEPVYLLEDTAAQYMRDVSEKLSEVFIDRSYLKEYSARGAAERVKGYLNLTTAIRYREEGISVALNGYDSKAHFILRTAKKIDMKNSSGFTLQNIDEEVYLLIADGTEMSVIFKP